MKIMLVGNMGYVGPAVVRQLYSSPEGWEICGFDTGYFAHCLTARGLPETLLSNQHFGDVRTFPAALLAGVDAVVYLAAISNDPMGARFEEVTMAVNQDAALRLARLCAEAGVSRFVFASSCSLYGFAEGDARREEDALNPLTAYARSKAGAEDGLRQIAEDTGLSVTALRFATACGYSSRTRLDLVLNDLVASALTRGRIDVLSDGSPWRPLIHVRDMARAIEWALGRAAQGDFLVVNVGADQWNHQVIELAKAVSGALSGTAISVNRDAPPDRRSYRVDFSRYVELAPNHQPRERLEETVRELAEELDRWLTHIPDYRTSSLIRFNVLEDWLSRDALTPDLFWRDRRPAGPGRTAVSPLPIAV